METFDPFFMGKHRMKAWHGQDLSFALKHFGHQIKGYTSGHKWIHSHMEQALGAGYIRVKGDYWYPHV